MWKTTLLTLLFLFAAVLAIAACRGSVPCPLHDLTSTWTGRSFFTDGVTVGVYRCPRGHTFEVRCN